MQVDHNFLNSLVPLLIPLFLFKGIGCKVPTRGVRLDKGATCLQQHDLLTSDAAAHANAATN